MKKTNILMAFSIFIICLFMAPSHTYAWESASSTSPQDMASYYDINEDGQITISDLVLIYNAFYYEGTLSANDFSNVANYLSTGTPIDVTYEECDIDDMTVTAENIQWIETVTSGKIVDFEFSSSIRYRFLNNGTVTELRLSSDRIEEIVDTLAVLDYHGERITLGVTADNHFAWDTYSFDFVPGYDESYEKSFYEEWDIDDMPVTSENTTWLANIMSDQITYIDVPTDECSFAFGFFNENENKITEIRLARIGKIVETVAIVDFNGERIVLGINDNNEYVLDEYSFDIVPE
jgi:hypothetical protein